MDNLSIQIESGIDTVLEGLNYDIKIDYKIKENSEYENYINYNCSVELRNNTTIKGKIVSVSDKSFTISYYVKKDKDRTLTEKIIAFTSAKSVRVYNDEAGLLEPDKMKQIIDSKISSFNSAKNMMNKWVSSPNAPSQEKVKTYLEKIVSAGDKALEFLREALAHNIDYDALESHKIHNAVKAKPIILEAIFELDSSLIEMKSKLESDDLSLTEREFKLGYPERFAKGEFYSKQLYHLKWYDEKNDAVRICPFSTIGKTVELDGLKIVLPKVPKDKSKIMFSDLPKKEQYWRRPEQLQKINPNNQTLWDDFIKEEFRRRREGVWFMNDGEPVYLTGNHYFAMTWCKMLDTGGYMDFRYAQLNMFYHIEACLVDERCLGQLFVKSRRTGFTYSILSVFLNEITGIRNKNFGMTSKNDSDAKKAFLKFRYMLLNLPFYFLPLIKGRLDSPKEFEFSNPLNNTKQYKKDNEFVADDYLNNFIDYEPTKNDSYDGQALYRYLGDEAGKWRKPSDYILHFGQISPTMNQGGNIVGKAFIGSTVGALSRGGEQFKEMYEDSDILERDPITNMTTTGLYRYFLPAQENMEAFTDKYGKCYQEKPKVPTMNVKGKPINVGSLDYLISQEESKKADSDKKLNEQYRAFPRTIEHAFRDEANECSFNITKLYEQLEYNENLPEDARYMIGNFDWVDQEDGDVAFFPNPKGRFKVSWLPSVVDGTQALANNVAKIGDKFYPLNKECVRFGCDPFSLKSTHGKGSKGGIHGKTLMFPEGGAPSNEFVVEYIARPSDETIFFEDVIKVIRFYGAPILVESNRVDLLRHMRNRGYRPFAMDRLDKHPSKLNPNEKEYGGQPMSGKDMLDSHLNSIGLWIEKYVGLSNNPEFRELGEMGNMPFNETLTDWLKFDPDDRTKYDATISSGLAIMACQTEKYKGVKKERKVRNVTFIKKYNNQGAFGSRVN